MNKKRWSKEDFNNCHSDFNGGMTVKDLVMKYNRTEKSVLAQLNKRCYQNIGVLDTPETLAAKTNNITKPDNHFQMIQIVDEYKEGKTVNELITKFGLDEHMIVYCLLEHVKSKIPKHKITHTNSQKWTKREINFLANNKKMSIVDISKALKNRTCQSIVREQISLHICSLFTTTTENKVNDESNNGFSDDECAELFIEVNRALAVKDYEFEYDQGNFFLTEGNYGGYNIGTSSSLITRTINRYKLTGKTPLPNKNLECEAYIFRYNEFLDIKTKKVVDPPYSFFQLTKSLW